MNYIHRFILSVLLLTTPCSWAITIGTVEEPPGNFSHESGMVMGLSVDFVKEIQKRLGDSSPIQMQPPSRLIYNSLNKKDFLLFSLSRTKEREDKYHWITLVMRKPLVMFARKDSKFNINNLEDAKKVDSIGVLHSSVQHDFLIKNNFQNIYPSYKHKQNMKMLMLGRLSLMYYSMQGAAKLSIDLGFNFDLISPVLILQTSLSSIAMSKDSDPDLVKQWQETAKAIKEDGTFELLAQKWLRYTEEVIGIPSEIKDGALNFWRSPQKKILTPSG